MIWADIPVIRSYACPEDKIYFIPGRVCIEANPAMLERYGEEWARRMVGGSASLRAEMRRWGFEPIEYEEPVPEWLRVSEGL